MDKKPTISDLAEIAGVSPATVSRVLNHSHLVNRATYDKVMESIEKIGYELPRHRELRKQDSSNIVVVNSSSFCSTNYPEYMKGISTSSHRYNWKPIVTQDSLNETNIESYLKTLDTIRPCGVLLLNHVKKSVLEMLGSKYPVIQCGEYNDASNIPYVGINDCAAARNMVSYLISRGTRRLVLVNAPTRFYFARERQRGFELAMQDAGIAPSKEDIIELPDSTFAMAHVFINSILSINNPPDALFAATDTIAYAAILSAKENGLRVPEDIAIAGFENLNISIMSSPKITTISLPCFQLGFIGCELLHEQYVSQTMSTQNILLNTELIIRDSTR